MPLFSPERLSLCHIQTDGFTLRVRSAASTGESVFDELAKMKDFCDFSRVPKEIEQLYDETNRNKPLYLKLESVMVKSFISLRPHVYSYVTVLNVKNMVRNIAFNA